MIGLGELGVRAAPEPHGLGLQLQSDLTSEDMRAARAWSPPLGARVRGWQGRP